MGGKKGAAAAAAKAGKKKKQNKKKTGESFLKKEWYDLKAPAIFPIRDIGKTIVNRTQGNKLSADSLRGRVIEVSQGDLTKDAEQESYRIFKFKVEEVQGRSCLSSFHGMRLSADKLRLICKKWHTLIETHLDVKTSEGYVLRVFAIAFTARMANQIRKTSYAQSSQVRAIRKRMNEVLEKEINGKDLNDLITRLMSRSIGKEIEKACQSIYPLQNAFVRKVKTLKSPKTDLNTLIEMHGGAGAITSFAEDLGSPVERTAATEVEAETE